LFALSLSLIRESSFNAIRLRRTQSGWPLCICLCGGW